MGGFLFGGDGGALRFACGLLALRAAQPLGGASRPLKTPTLRRFLNAASSPLMQRKNKEPIGRWTLCFWWGWRGSNPRPLRCERSALTSWATSPRKGYFIVSGQKWQALFVVLRAGIFKPRSSRFRSNISPTLRVRGRSFAWARGIFGSDHFFDCFGHCAEYSSDSVQ